MPGFGFSFYLKNSRGIGTTTPNLSEFDFDGLADFEIDKEDVAFEV